MLRVLILLVALVAGGGAAWLAYGVQQGESQAAVPVEQVPQIALQDVLVAAADIEEGQALNAENLRWQSWPEEALSETFISRDQRPDAIEELNQMMVRSRFTSGEPINERKLVQGAAGLLSATLAAGKRAVAVRVSAENTAGGFILPGDRVDVLLTNAREGRRPETRTLLQGVRVLAIDQQATDGEADAVIGKTATLELEPREAEIITAAEASGSLSLALRSAADLEEAPGQEVAGTRTIRVLSGGRAAFVEIN